MQIYGAHGRGYVRHSLGLFTCIALVPLVSVVWETIDALQSFQVMASGTNMLHVLRSRNMCWRAAKIGAETHVCTRHARWLTSLQAGLRPDIFTGVDYDQSVEAKKSHHTFHDNIGPRFRHECYRFQLHDRHSRLPQASYRVSPHST